MRVLFLFNRLIQNLKPISTSLSSFLTSSSSLLPSPEKTKNKGHPEKRMTLSYSAHDAQALANAMAAAGGGGVSGMEQQQQQQQQHSTALTNNNNILPTPETEECVGGTVDSGTRVPLFRHLGNLQLKVVSRSFDSRNRLRDIQSVTSSSSVPLSSSALTIPRTRDGRATPSEYILPLGDAQANRVVLVSLADFALSDDPRKIVDYTRRHFQLAGPLYIPANSTVSLEETSTLYDRDAVTTTTGFKPIGGTDTIVEETTHDPVELSIPATITHIDTAFDEANDTVRVTTETPHFLETVLRHWPKWLQQSVRIRASRYYNGDPVLTPDNVEIVSSTEFVVDTTTFTGQTDGPTPAEAIENAVIYVPELTPLQYMYVYRSMLEEARMQSQLRAAYTLQQNADTGHIEFYVADTVRRRARQMRRIEITTRIRVSPSSSPAGSPWRRLNLPVASTMRRFSERTRRDPVTQMLIDEVPHIYRSFPMDLRTVELERGNYSPSTLTRALNRRTNAFWIPVGTPLEERRIRIEDNVGERIVIELLQGRYYPAELAAYVTAELVTALTAIASANDIVLEYDRVKSQFTFRDVNGIPFALDLRSPEGTTSMESAPTMATTALTTTSTASIVDVNEFPHQSVQLSKLLGFDSVRRPNRSVHTGSSRVANAFLDPTGYSELEANEGLQYSLHWTYDGRERRLQASRVPPWNEAYVDGVPDMDAAGETITVTLQVPNAAQVSNATTTPLDPWEYDPNELTPVSHFLRPGDVVYVREIVAGGGGGKQRTFSLLVEEIVGISTVRLYSGSAGDFLSDVLADPIVGGDLRVTWAGDAEGTEFWGVPLAAHENLSSVDVVGREISPYDMYPAAQRAVFSRSAKGTGAAYGPVASLLGFESHVLVSPPLPSSATGTTSSVAAAAGSGGDWGDLELDEDNDGILRAPNVLSLARSPYILMQLVRPHGGVSGSSHSYTDLSDGSRHLVPILAKLVMTDGGFARLSSEMLQVAFPDPISLTELHLRFVNPDGSPVFFEGVEHTFSLHVYHKSGKTEAGVMQT